MTAQAEVEAYVDDLVARLRAVVPLDAAWFVLDRAIAEEHAVSVFGPRWQELFAPVPREDIVAALRDSLDYNAREEPLAANSLLNNTCGAWRWVETDEWVSKPEAARWFRRRVRSVLEGAS